MNKEELFKEITTEMLNIFIKKNTDYGSSVSDTYRDFGIVSFLVRMQDKLNRLKTLSKQDTDSSYESKEKFISLP